MHIRDLNGKKICILGFGREGQAMLNALHTHAPNADVTIADANETCQIPITRNQKPETRNQLGSAYLQNLHQFDVIIKSPGIPWKPEITAVRTKVTSSTQIFLDSIRDSGAIIIGVTGSKGKSTTSSLIYELLKAAKKDVHLIGNIGTPSIEYIDQAKSTVVFVMEMSSYQLMDLTVSPHIAVVTSFFPEHLDYHGSLKAYQEAKAHIARFQTNDDVIFYNKQSEGAQAIAEQSKGKKVGFSADDSPVTVNQTKLLGNHNLSNIAAAFKVAKHLGITDKTAITVFQNFRGLPHRLQSLGIHHNIEWVDDAISTTPDSTIAALDALGDRVTTLILGGQDRGVPYEHLGKRIAAQSSIRTIILFPGSGPRIKKAIEEAGANVTFCDAETMKAAVSLAKQHTQNSPFDSAQGKKLKTENSPKTPKSSHIPIVLLSTAAPSYGMFKNFEEKGDAFKQCIQR